MEYTMRMKSLLFGKNVRQVLGEEPVQSHHQHTLVK
jgi:hypothetical protein